MRLCAVLCVAAGLIWGVGPAAADFEADMGKATALRIEKKYDQAIRALAEMAGVYADDGNAQGEIGYSKGLILEEQGKFQEALSAYAAAADSFPSSPAAGFAKLGRARVLEKLGMAEQAVETYAELVSRYPRLGPSALLSMASALEGLGRRFEAAQTYRRLRDGYPLAREAEIAKTSLASVCEEIGKKPLAAKDFSEAMARGECLMDQGEFREAQLLYEKALRRKPDADTAVQLLMRLASSFEAQDRHLKAERAYRRIIRTVPKTPRAAEAHMRIIQQCFDRERWREAIRELEKMARDYADTPEASRARYLIGSCYESLGQREKAQAAYREVIGMDPQNPWAVQANLSMMRLMESAP